MNLLGHLSLSQRNPAIMLGNFAGDFVKGRKFERYNPSVAKGILLHRQIDSFTDQHETVRRSAKRLQPSFGKFAPVIVDVMYDYFLAHNWERFHEGTVDSFAAFCYETLLPQKAQLPTDAQQALTAMAKYDWLTNYAEPEGIRRALAGISRRSVYADGLEAAVETMLLHRTEFEEEFLTFYPQVIAFSQEFLA